MDSCLAKKAINAYVSSSFTLNTKQARKNKKIIKKKDDMN